MDRTGIPENTLHTNPQIAVSAFIAKGAKILGDVRIEAQVSIWYNAVLRGDINYIYIQEQSNIQDGCVIHVENHLPCIIGKNVTVGHNAVLHGCTIEDECMIGIGAIVLSGAYIKKGSVIGAGAVVKEETIVPENTLMVGIPAKPIRTLSENIREANISMAEKYYKVGELHNKKYGGLK